MFENYHSDYFAKTVRPKKTLMKQQYKNENMSIQ